MIFCRHVRTELYIYIDYFISDSLHKSVPYSTFNTCTTIGLQPLRMCMRMCVCACIYVCVRVCVCVREKLRVHWSGDIVEQALVEQTAARRDGDGECQHRGQTRWDFRHEHDEHNMIALF